MNTGSPGLAFGSPGDDREVRNYATWYYLGPETPNPLYITVLRATVELPNLKTVLKDIMGLTKINYNACDYSDAVPVTIRFADKVGEVLVMGSAEGVERQPFKFYV